MARELTCQSCGEQKLTLNKVRSSLINTMELVMCNTCISLKYEPRYIIILAARTRGLEDIVRKFIKERRYKGTDIPAAYVL